MNHVLASIVWLQSVRPGNSNSATRAAASEGLAAAKKQEQRSRHNPHDYYGMP
jgi:hypothetical protein